MTDIPPIRYLNLDKFRARCKALASEGDKASADEIIQVSLEGIGHVLDYDLADREYIAWCLTPVFAHCFGDRTGDQWLYEAASDVMSYEVSDYHAYGTEDEMVIRGAWTELRENIAAALKRRQGEIGASSLRICHLSAPHWRWIKSLALTRCGVIGVIHGAAFLRCGCQGVRGGAIERLEGTVRFRCARPAPARVR
jgi:hypothetical protein